MGGWVGREGGVDSGRTINTSTRGPAAEGGGRGDPEFREGGGTALVGIVLGEGGMELLELLAGVEQAEVNVASGTGTGTIVCHRMSSPALKHHPRRQQTAAKFGRVVYYKTTFKAEQ